MINYYDQEQWWSCWYIANGSVLEVEYSSVDNSKPGGLRETVAAELQR